MSDNKNETTGLKTLRIELDDPAGCGAVVLEDYATKFPNWKDLSFFQHVDNQWENYFHNEYGPAFWVTTTDTKEYMEFFFIKGEKIDAEQAKEMINNRKFTDAFEEKLKE